MTPAILVTLVSVAITVVLAGVGAVWRLGDRVGEMRTLTTNAGASLKSVADTFTAIDRRIDDQDRKIALLESQWRTTHKLVETVMRLMGRVDHLEGFCAARHERSLAHHIEARTADRDAPEAIP